MNKITKGNRHAALYKKASDLKDDGATYDQIERTIQYMNREVISPPVSAGNIRRLLTKVSKWFSKEAVNA